MGRRLCLLGAVAAVITACVVPGPSGAASSPVVDPTVPAKRDTEPIILKGSDLLPWAVPANQTVKFPFMDLAGSESCASKVDPSKTAGLSPTAQTPQDLFDKLQALGDNGVGIPDPGPLTNDVVTYGPDQCPPQHYANPELDTASAQPAGTPTDRILGYAWNGKAFRQIPLQVDEVFTRYLDNSRSGFAIYSGQDAHTSYAFDREGFRWTSEDPNDPCQARPNSDVAKDPIQGLDTNDEVAFMAADAAGAAPAGTPLPAGIDDARQVAIVDPTDKGNVNYVYVMKARADGPKPAYDASNGYVRYQRDANADTFAFSQSNYKDYGNAPSGIYCDPATGKPTGYGRRRPIDTATISTKRYSFRYDGRWLLTKIQISPNDNWTYGPDIVDRWKARAFAQDPSSNTPCCGYEEEDSNWGGSSSLLGERSGPVRTIRETWGADSGTNVVRRETFYKDELRQKTFLRVHVIPPLDGIYAQWDFNAGRVNRFYNPRTADKGVPVDGKNDEAFGNLDDPCNSNYNKNDTSQADQGYRTLYQETQICSRSLGGQTFPYHQSIDAFDPTFSDANAALAWAEVAGPYGSIVDRTTSEVTDISPGGGAQAIFATPYYRDDACFDDGTGSDPGIEMYPRHPDQERNLPPYPPGSDWWKPFGVSSRDCWRGTPAVPAGDPQFWQGDIGAHGLHLLMVAESDNARQTFPVDEIVSETRMVMLPGQRDGTAGEQYGRSFEKALRTVIAPTFGALPGDTGGGSTGGGSKPGSGGSTQGSTTGSTTNPANVAGHLNVSGTSLGLPSSGRCVSGRVIRFHVVAPVHRAKVRRATVEVNGKVIKRVRGDNRLVVLRGLNGATVVVRVRVRATNGRLYIGQRTYHLCAVKHSSHYHRHGSAKRNPKKHP